MTTEALVQRVITELNRPDADDLFLNPDDYHDALTRAQKYWYRRVTSHYPDLLKVQKGPITSNDGGDTYPLGDDHLGEMEVWTPPGPPDGDVLTPTVPESGRFGFYVEGEDLKLTFTHNYDPGLYIRWVPASITEVDEDNDPTLPNYFEEALVNRAAYYLASKPGFLGNADFYKNKAREEWAGDPDDPSDAGLLGTLSRQSAHRGRETLSGSHPWYKRIGR